MADLPCVVCSEPWENDSLHDMPKGTVYYENYPKAAADFRKYGCGLFKHAWDGATLEVCKGKKSANSDMLQAIYDMSGGDMDGAAVDIEDAEAMGFL